MRKAGLVGGLALVISMPVYNFLKHNDVQYQEGNNRVVEEVDGLFSHVMMERDIHGNYFITKNGMMGINVQCYQTNKTGEVTEITLASPFSIGSNFRRFNRREDYQGNEQLFADADEDSRVQIERFREKLEN